MKKKTILTYVLTALLFVSAAGVSACGAWWQNLANNPVAEVQAFEQSVQVVLNVAETSWSVIEPLLPANIQAQAQAAYKAAILVVNKAIVALNDAVQAAVAAKGPAPDFTAVMQAVSDAIAQVVSIINQFKVQVPASAVAGTPKVVGVDELNAAVVSMHHVGGVK